MLVSFNQGIHARFDEIFLYYNNFRLYFHTCTWGSLGCPDPSDGDLPPAEWVSPPELVKMRKNERFLTIFRGFSAIFDPADPPHPPENFCCTCMFIIHLELK